MSRIKMEGGGIKELPELLRGLTRRDFLKTLQNAHKAELRVLRRMITANAPHRKGARVHNFANLKRAGTWPIQNSGRVGAFIGAKWPAAQTALWTEGGTGERQTRSKGRRGRVAGTYWLSRTFERYYPALQGRLPREYSEQAVKTLQREVRKVERAAARIRARL